MQAPKVCPLYQTGIYNGRVNYNNHHFIHHFGPSNYSQEKPEKRTKICMEVQPALQHYHYEITVHSLEITQMLSGSFG